jgi:acyl-phosphate glycerol 3-phosphate acyltransferase
MIIKLILIAVISYLLGDINPAIVIGKIKGVDIRKEGSGNPGMTNAIRVMGIGAGIAVFAVDVLKAFASVKIGYALAGDTGAMIAFAAVVLGHCFPALYGFKGGKGVAASFGAVLALNWQSALIVLAVAAVLFLIFRRMSIGSLGAAISYPFLVHHFAAQYTYFGIAVALFLLIMHRENIVRLFKGEEKPLTIGHKGKEADSGSNEEARDDK